MKLNREATVFAITGSLVFVLVSLLFIIPIPHYTDGFRTITEIENLAHNMDEFVSMDGGTLAVPIYDSFHKNQVQNTFFKKIVTKFQALLYYCGLIKSPSFSTDFFEYILNMVSVQRKKGRLVGNYIQKIELEKSSRVVVIGALQGAFHSLARDLRELSRLKIIDANLKLLKSTDFIVFLGNGINRSPFGLETFTLILKLLQNNPKNVFYLKGTNEYEESWRNLTLKNELKTRISLYQNKSLDSLEKSVQIFFDTLPLSIYCFLPSDTFQSNTVDELNIIQLLPSMDDPLLKETLINDVNITELKKRPSSNQNAIPLEDFLKETSGHKKNPASGWAILCDIKKRLIHETSDGLRLIDPTHGIISWAILSSPTEPFRIGLGFHNDAFTIIHYSETNGWLVTLHKRDIRTDNKFLTRNYNVFSGFPID